MEFVNNLNKYNIRKYENLASNNIREFCEELEEIFKKNGTKDLLFVIKVSGVFIDPFNINKLGSQKKAVRTFLKDMLSQEDYKILETEILKINYLNDISNTYNTSIDELLESENEPEYSVAKLLLTANKMLAEMNDAFYSEIRQLNADESTENVFIDLFTNDDFEVADADKMFVGLCSIVSDILKYLMFYKRNTLNKKSYNKIYSKHSELKVKNAVRFTMEQGLVNFFIDYWKYSEIDIEETQVKKSIYIKDNDLNDFYNIKNTRTQLFTNILQNKVLKNNSAKQNQSDFEVFVENDKENLAQKYHISNFNKKINDIELKDWLKAYAIIQNECNIFLTRPRKKTKQFLKAYCLIKPRKYWEKKFGNMGLTNIQSKQIIDFFTFTKESSDLLDSPFIKIEGTDELLIIPQMIKATYISNALASNLTSKEADAASFRGFGFEETVNELLNKCNIRATGVKQEYQGATYECDSCFVIDKTLYFIECKSHSEPETFDRCVKNAAKLIDETHQIVRTANHFGNHNDYILKSLDLDKNTEILETKKIILSATEIGNAIYINDVYITDYSTFSNFFLRNKLVVRDNEGKVLYRAHKEEYNGGISSEKFDKVLNTLLFESEMLKNRKKETFILEKVKDIEFTLNGIEFSSVMMSKDVLPLEKMMKQFGN